MVMVCSERMSMTRGFHGRNHVLSTPARDLAIPLYLGPSFAILCSHTSQLPLLDRAPYSTYIPALDSAIPLRPVPSSLLAILCAPRDWRPLLDRSPPPIYP